MRVTTWNIHGAVGTDRRRDPQRIAAAIGALAPDILALQEVTLAASDTDPVGFLDRVAAAVGEGRAEAYTIETADRRYGITLLSRFDIHSVRVHDLSFRRREPRTAIEAMVETPEGAVRVITAHLGLSRLERAAQIEILRARVADGADRPTILLGDFNDWRLPGRIGRVFAELLPTQIAPKSFPSGLPLFELDRILLSPGLVGEAVRVDTDRRASDHRPVSAEVRRR